MKVQITPNADALNDLKELGFLKDLSFLEPRNDDERLCIEAVS